jgi:hypothetical protein
MRGDGDGGHGSGHLWLWIVTAGGLVYGDHALHLHCMACSFEFEGMMCMYPAGHVMPPYELIGTTHVKLSASLALFFLFISCSSRSLALGSLIFSNFFLLNLLIIIVIMCVIAGLKKFPGK